jgi:hypothetical protein
MVKSAKPPTQDFTMSIELFFDRMIGGLADELDVDDTESQFEGTQFTRYTKGATTAANSRLTKASLYDFLVYIDICLTRSTVALVALGEKIN